MKYLLAVACAFAAVSVISSMSIRNCSLEAKEKWSYCTKAGNWTENECGMWVQGWAEDNCLNKNATCKGNTWKIAKICAGILKDLKPKEEIRQICAGAAKSFYVRKCMPIPECTRDARDRFHDCLDDKKDDEDCGEEAEEFVNENCINKNATCEKQADQMFYNCFILYPEAGVCSGVRKEYLMKCGPKEGGSCVKTAKAHYYGCMKSGNWTEEQCGMYVQGYVEEKCLNKNRSCKVNGKIMKRMCMKILEDSEHEDKAGKICEGAAKSYLFRNCNVSSCTMEAKERFHDCLEDKKEGEDCGRDAEEYIKENCISKNASCEQQAGQVFKNCYVLYPDARACGYAARESYMKCSNASSSVRRCAMTLKGIYDDCLKHDDKDHCGEQVKGLAVKNCLKPSKSCKKRSRAFRKICMTIIKDRKVCGRALREYKKNACGDE